MRSEYLTKRSYLYPIVFLIWLITIITKFKFNGLVYGLDFGLFHPDGTLYTFRTLTWMGKSQEQAGLEVANWYSNHAHKMKDIDPSALFYDSNPNWQFYKIRLLYSFLSLPFVYFLGINGMLVVPALSYLGVLLIILEIGIAKQRILLSLSLVFAFSISGTVTRWMFINTTDSLFVFLGSLATILLLRHNASRWWLVAQLSLVVLMSLTRVSIFFWLPVALALFFQSRIRAILIAVISLAAFSPVLFMDPQKAFMPGVEDGSLGMKVEKFIPNGLRVLVYELGQLLVMDRLLLLILLATIILSFRFIHSSSSKFLLFLGSGLFFMGAVNGTVGVNFRYQLPAIAAMSWVLIDHLPRMTRDSNSRVDG